MSYLIKCDRCSKMGPQGNNNFQPPKWKTIGLTITVSGGNRHKWHHFCPECTEYLQIDSEITEETSTEKLVVILESIIEEKIDEKLENNE